MLMNLMMEHGLVLNIINVKQTKGCLCYCQDSNLVQGTNQEVCMTVCICTYVLGLGQRFEFESLVT